jgi:CHAD domain-containing protein
LRQQAKHGQEPVEPAAAKLLRHARADLAKQSRILQRNTDLEQWHQFRIHAKRQRYIFELLQSLPLPGLAEEHAALKELQDKLGAIQDCSAMAAVARKAAGGGEPIAANLQQLLERQQELVQCPPQWPPEPGF